MAATVVTPFPGEKIETQGMKRLTYTDLNVECQSQGLSLDARLHICGCYHYVQNLKEHQLPVLERAHLIWWNDLRPG